ncbi:MAG TPA: hypothetical protein VGB31_08970, partial [Myxococcota bacterium]
ALIRRGLDPKTAPERAALPPEMSPDGVWSTWANHALVAGHRDTARHYAIKAFRAAPWRHWKLPIRIWLGIQPFLWKRWRQKLQKRVAR